MDGDHVLVDLRDRFDELLATLEAAAGWETERVRRPVLILGQLDGILTGIRQLRRTRPLETEMVQGLRVPTLAEMARIKGWLLATRDTTRDYLDTVVLLERLGEAGARAAFAAFDEIYRQPNGASPLAELVERLAQASPADLAQIDLASYRGLVSPWNDWAHVAGRGRAWATLLASLAMEPPP
jgi:tryptophan 2,3-dioxygenase